MNYLKIEQEDVCNGIGLRCTIWLTGCDHKCMRCFNEESWDSDNGIPFEDNAKQEVFNILSKPYIDGITLTGGDPLYSENLDDVLSLIKEIRSQFPSKTIWLYTGYTWDYIMNGIGYDGQGTFFFVQDDKKRYEIMSLCDVVIDGEYIDKLRDVTLKWRGSSNQRVIDVPKSLEQNKVVLYCD